MRSDLVLHLGLGDRRAEVVLGLDRGGDLFAQHDRLRRRVDRHFELRLLVFFDAEVAAAHGLANHQADTRPAWRRRAAYIRPRSRRSRRPGSSSRATFSPLGSCNLDGELLIGEVGRIRPDRTGRGEPRT